MKTRSILILIFSILMHACGERITPDSGVSKELADERKATVSELAYHLKLTVPDSLSEAIRAESSMLFKLNTQADVYLDFKGKSEQLTMMRVNGHAIDRLEVTQEHIRIPGKHLIGGGAENRVELHFLAGEEALNRNRNYLYSLFVPERARTAIPCFDQPNLKARFSVSFDLPETWTGVTNGALLKEVTRGNRRLMDFAPSQPLSSYLWSFAAGCFKLEQREWKGMKIGLYHLLEDEAKVARNREQIFELTTSSLEWLEEYTDFKYPYDTYNLIALPAFQFGGMEHPGATYYRSEIIFLDENPTLNEELKRANLIAHETAHMWFGDLVTMKWFDEVWLKEVFANFLADKMVEKQFKAVNHNLRFLLAHFPAAYAVDRTLGANPINQELKNLNQAGTLYGGIIYHKSPIVMKHLEQLLGSENLQKGVRNYVKKYAYANADWKELISCLDAYTEVDLKSWSRVWVDIAGRPEIWAEAAQAGGWNLKQKPEHPELSGANEVWTQELLLKQEGESESIAMTSQATPVQLNLGAKNWFFDGGILAYGLFRMQEEQLNYWLREAPSIGDELKRGRMSLELYENFLAGGVAPEAYFACLKSWIGRETNLQILERLCSQINTVFWHFLEREQQAKLSTIEEDLWLWLEKSKLPAQKKVLFRCLLNLGMSEHTTNHLIAVFNEPLAVKGLVLGDEDWFSLSCRLAIKSGQGGEAWEQLLEKRVKSKAIREKYRFVLPVLSPDPLVREQFFNALAQLENRVKEPWVQEALFYLFHPMRPGGEKYLKRALELLPEIRQTGDIFFPINWLSNSVGLCSSEEAYNTVDAFLKSHPDFPENLRLKVWQSADLCKRAVEIKKRYM